MNIRPILKNPVILGIVLGLAYILAFSSKGILSLLTGPIIIVIGTIFLVIISLGVSGSLRSLTYNHLKFSLISSILCFFGRFLIEKDFSSALQAFFAVFVWFIITSLIINTLKNMKKGHWITIIILSVFTIGFIMFAFVQKISYDRLKEVSLKYYDIVNERVLILEKKLEARDLKIDSLNIEINELKTKR